MARSKYAAALAAVSLAFAAVDTANAQGADPVVKQATELHQKGNAIAAYALLAPLAESRAGEPNFDYILALAAVDSGRPAEAILALQRVLAVQPKNMQARAELARVYVLAGDVDTAKREFDTVVDDPSLPDPVRQRFNRIVRDLDRAQNAGGTDVSGFAEATMGYDSNINSATGLTAITLPIFAGLGPATLSGGATRIGDGFGGIEGGVSVTSGVSRQTRLFASALGSHRNNFDSLQFDQTRRPARRASATRWPTATSSRCPGNTSIFGSGTIALARSTARSANIPSVSRVAARSLSARNISVSNIASIRSAMPTAMRFP